MSESAPKPATVTKEQMRDHYTNVFCVRKVLCFVIGAKVEGEPPYTDEAMQKALDEPLNRALLERLEVSFVFEGPQNKEFFVRNLMVESAASLAAYIREFAPVRILVSAFHDNHDGFGLSLLRLRWPGSQSVRYKRVSETGKITKFRPLKIHNVFAGPLVLDIDVDDWGRESESAAAIRDCACEGKMVCPRCWAMLVLGVGLGMQVLRFLGYKSVHCFFSGRRGMHVWIRDRAAMKLSTEGRRMLVDMLDAPHEFFANGDALFGPGEDTLGRFVAEQALPFAREQGLLDSGAPLEALEGNTSPDARLFYSVFRLRIDSKCLFDRRHLIGVPGSIHNGSGNMVTYMGSRFEDLVHGIPRLESQHERRENIRSVPLN